jgi:Protein of unknown function (DUF2388).
MKKIVLTTAAVLSINATANAYGRAEVFAEDMSAATGMSSLFPFMVTGFTTFGVFSKVVADAKEDINLFVATEGETRTARFEGALNYIKQNFDTTNSSDLEIAQALIAQ